MKTYVTDELPLNLQAFITDYSKVYHAALIDTVNRRLAGSSIPDQSSSKFKSELNTYLQDTYKINCARSSVIGHWSLVIFCYSFQSPITNHPSPFFVCQFDGKTLRIRVPGCLEHIYEEYIEAEIKSFHYGQHLIEIALKTPGVTKKEDGSVIPIKHGIAMSYRFYYKDLRWFMAVSFELPAPQRASKPRYYGCIGIDLNPDSIGWAYADSQGNLQAKGKIVLHLAGKRKGQVKAIIGDAVKELTIIADTYACPIVCESLDFSRKKGELRERGRKYARMLSNFAYSRFFQALSSRCFNLGIELIQVNPAYSSLIGLVKYARLYGLASDEAAGLAIARRGMRLSERMPRAITALVEVNSARHVWHRWSKLNKKLTEVRRHSYYGISNWEPLVNPDDEEEQSNRSLGKRQRAKGSARI